MLAAASTVPASAAWMAVEMLATWWVRKAFSEARGYPVGPKSAKAQGAHTEFRDRVVWTH